MTRCNVGTWHGMTWHGMAHLNASSVDTESTCWLTDKSLFTTPYRVYACVRLKRLLLLWYRVDR